MARTPATTKATRQITIDTIKEDLRTLFPEGRIDLIVLANEGNTHKLEVNVDPSLEAMAGFR